MEYKWVMIANCIIWLSTAAGANIACIHFNTKLAKDNFCKYAYSYTYFNNDKSDCLASKTIAGANFAGTSGEMYFAIPQINWENIHINQKELWDKGLYDEAVLSEMGLMVICLVSLPMSLHSSSLTIFTIIWAGVSDSSTSAPTQRSVTDLVKSLTTL